MKIAVVAYRALPVALPDAKGTFGGLETAAWLTARALARQPGNEVSLIGRDSCSRSSRTVDGVRVVTRSEPLEIIRESLAGRLSVNNKFPWLHLQQWDASLLWKVPVLAAVRPFKRPATDQAIADDYFVRLNADIVCTFGVNAITATVLESCRQSGKRSVLFLQSNGDLDPRFATDPDYRNEYGERGSLCLQAIQTADCIIAQTAVQQQWLRDRFQRDCHVLGNPFDHEDWETRLNQRAKLPFPLPNEPFALWIGRADRMHKRPQLFLEAARKCPDVPFLMVLNPGEPQLEQEIRHRCPADVQIVSHVPFHLMPSLFARTFLLVFTGAAEHEGLPNVLLQSAASGVPIAALDFLPDLLNAVPFATVAGTPSELAAIINNAWQDREATAAKGNTGREFVRQLGGSNGYAQRLMEIFERLTVV